MADMSTRTSSEKIRIFRDLFTGLTNVYGTYDPNTGRAKQVKSPVTDKVLHAHLTGRQPYGVYLLMKDRTRSIAIDFDTNDTFAPTEFVARAKHYGISSYIERSKSKGYHVWIFFERQGVKASKARLVVFNILEEIEKPDTEVFPKQDELDKNAPYGNYINAPLWGKVVDDGRTVFVNPTTFESYPDQWELLESVHRHSESNLDEIIELNDLSASPECKLSKKTPKDRDRLSFSLPLCAQNMLRDGVSEYQRVSCFRLAVHFKRLGVPYDIAVSALKTWALKNKPINGKGVIQGKEIISQTEYAYNNSYTGYGCNSPAITRFCEPSCPINKWKMHHERIPPGEGKDNEKGILNSQLPST